MKQSVYVFDPTADDPLSKVRGVGRYLQLLKENFPDWSYSPKLLTTNYQLPPIFINPFFNFLQSPLTMRRVAKKQLAVIHDLIPLKYPDHFPVGLKGRFNIFLNKLALKNYDVIVTDSEASKKDVVSMLKVEENRVKVIYPCLPRIFTKKVERGTWNVERKNALSSKFYVPQNFCLYVGDATWNKNLVNLAKAIKIINVTCVFVGKVFDLKTRELVNSQNNKWAIELRHFFDETKNDKRFIFAGFLPDQDLIKLYQQARCNILISRDEGFGFSYLETASQGCPSVLSDITVLREISNSKGGLFAHPEKPNDIANAIGEVFFNKDVRNKLGLEAQQRTKYFNREKFKNSWNLFLPR